MVTIEQDLDLRGADRPLSSEADIAPAGSVPAQIAGLSAKTDTVGNIAARDPVITVRGANVWYGETHALKDVNLDIGRNEVVALIGPSGCGKSTFIRCLNRLHEINPDARLEGKVKIGEMEVYAPGTSPVEVRRRVGMVFQKPNPFPTMSVFDNVAAGLKLNGFRNRRGLAEAVEQ